MFYRCNSYYLRALGQNWDVQKYFKPVLRDWNPKPKGCWGINKTIKKEKEKKRKRIMRVVIMIMVLMMMMMKIMVMNFASEVEKAGCEAPLL